MSKSSAIDQVKSWLTPTLLLVIGYFAKAKMDSIDEKLNQVVSLQTQVATLSARTDALDKRTDGVSDDLGKLLDRFNEHLSALPSAEITLKKRNVE